MADKNMKFQRDWLAEQLTKACHNMGDNICFMDHCPFDEDDKINTCWSVKREDWLSLAVSEQPSKRRMI